MTSSEMSDKVLHEFRSIALEIEIMNVDFQNRIKNITEKIDNLLREFQGVINDGK